MLDPSTVFATVIVVALGLGLWIAVAVTYACYKLWHIEIATMAGAIGVSPRALMKYRREREEEALKELQEEKAAKK